MGWVSDDIIADLRGSHEIGIYFRMDSDPPLRLWMGVNDVPQRLLAYDTEGDEIYLGGGRLQNIPYLEILLNGAADRQEFTMSGIDPDTLGLAAEELPEVRGCAVHIGITTLDDHHQPKSAIIPLLEGTASLITEASEPVEGTDNIQVTMGLSVAFGNVTRSRKTAVMWSAAMQRALYPTDAGCDGTARLARGVQPVWPRW